MTTEIPFTPVTLEALARLTPAEQRAFQDAAVHVAAEHKPPMGTVVTLVETIQRLITEPAGGGLHAALREAVTAQAQAAYLPAEAAGVLGDVLGIALEATVASVRQLGWMPPEEVAAAVAAERERIRARAEQECDANLYAAVADLFEAPS